MLTIVTMMRIKKTHTNKHDDKSRNNYDKHIIIIIISVALLTVMITIKTKSNHNNDKKIYNDNDYIHSDAN